MFMDVCSLAGPLCSCDSCSWIQPRFHVPVLKGVDVHVECRISLLLTILITQNVACFVQHTTRVCVQARHTFVSIPDLDS